MHYSHDVSRVQHLETKIEDGKLMTCGTQRVGFGVWALDLPEGVKVTGLRLEERLLVDGFDLPAGPTQYGRVIYLRNSTPVLIHVDTIGKVEIAGSTSDVKRRVAG